VFAEVSYESLSSFLSSGKIWTSIESLFDGMLNLGSSNLEIMHVVDSEVLQDHLEE